MRSNLFGEAYSPLEKTVKPKIVKKELSDKYTKSKVVFGTKDYRSSVDNVETKGWRRLTETEQREIAQIDPYISAIISTRCSQGATVGYPSDSKFDKGMKIVEINPIKEDDYEDKEQFEALCKQRDAEIEAIRKWVLYCGTQDEDVINAAFESSDLTFKKCSLREFIESQIRNLESRIRNLES